MRAPDSAVEVPGRRCLASPLLSHAMPMRSMVFQPIASAVMLRYAYASSALLSAEMLMLLRALDIYETRYAMRCRYFTPRHTLGVVIFQRSSLMPLSAAAIAAAIYASPAIPRDSAFIVAMPRFNYAHAGAPRLERRRRFLISLPPRTLYSAPAV